MVLLHLPEAQGPRKAFDDLTADRDLTLLLEPGVPGSRSHLTAGA
jgi:hypothetical protein